MTASGSGRRRRRGRVGRRRRGRVGRRRRGRVGRGSRVSVTGSTRAWPSASRSVSGWVAVSVSPRAWASPGRQGSRPPVAWACPAEPALASGVETGTSVSTATCARGAAVVGVSDLVARFGRHDGAIDDEHAPRRLSGLAALRPHATARPTTAKARSATPESRTSRSRGAAAAREIAAVVGPRVRRSSSGPTSAALPCDRGGTVGAAVARAAAAAAAVPATTGGGASDGSGRVAGAAPTTPIRCAICSAVSTTGASASGAAFDERPVRRRRTYIPIERSMTSSAPSTGPDGPSWEAPGISFDPSVSSGSRSLSVKSGAMGPRVLAARLHAGSAC